MAAVPKNRKSTIIKTLKAQKVPDDQIKLLSPTIDHLVWLEEKIEQGRQLISSSAIVMPYDNGGGQTGIRKNPAFEAIHRMTASYNATLKCIEDVIRTYSDGGTVVSIADASAIETMNDLRRIEREREHD